jgi:hypothetical protein
MTNKTMCAAQMAWLLKKGYAWEEPSNDGSLSDTYWTHEGGYQWDVQEQVFELVY